MRLIDADELIKNIPNEEMISKYAVAHAPTIDKFEIAKVSLKEAIDSAETIGDVIEKFIIANRPQGEWIPCSERLPQYRDVVLISTFWGVRVAERDGIKEDGTDDFWYLFLDDATAHPRYVYAWMPLPKPWKGADDE